MSHNFKLSLALVSGIMMAMPASAQTTSAPAKLDIKLFERGEIDRSKGCSFVLWQENRDPEKDRYAYAFAETLGRNQVRENSRIKIGAETLVFRRIAVGGAKEFGYKSFPYQLYKMDKEESFLILDLKLEDSPGEAMDVNGGTMTVIRPNFPPFSISVKGNAGCNTPAAAPAPTRSAAPPPQTNNDMAGMFERYPVRPQQVPAAIKRTAKQKFKCVDALMNKPFSGYQMSEESAIWEIPCDEFGGKNTFAYALVYLTDPSKEFTFKTFKAPPGKERSGEPNLLRAPQWDLKSRIVTATWLEGNDDCGTYERFRVTEEGEFQLIEFREQMQCGGKKVPPKDFPLIYRR